MAIARLVQQVQMEDHLLCQEGQSLQSLSLLVPSAFLAVSSISRTLKALTDVFTVVSSVLWYLAKKRSWEVRATIRKSARRVATALTPRRTTFPKDVHERRRSSRGLTKIDEAPNTPRTKTSDVEKGMPKMSSFEMTEPPKKSKWAQKLGRQPR